MHFCIILSHRAQHIDDMTMRSRLSPVPTVHDRSHLHAFLLIEGSAVPFLINNVYTDIIRHVLALHEHPCLIAYHMKNSDKWSLGSFNDFDDLAFHPAGGGLRVLKSNISMNSFFLNLLQLTCEANNIERQKTK